MVIDPVYRTKQCMLAQALRYGTAEQFREILKIGADPKRCDGGVDKLFYDVISIAHQHRNGITQGKPNPQLDKDFLDVLREFKIRPNNVQNFLSDAARLQSIYGIAYAIKELGANPNHINDKTGDTALRLALEDLYRHKDQTVKTIEILVKLGADPEAGISPGRSALSIVQNIKDQNLKARIESAMLQK